MLVDLQDMRWRGLLGTLFGRPGHMCFFPEQLTVNTPDIKQEEPGPFYQPPTIDDRELKTGVYAADRESLILALCQIRGIPLAFIKQVQDKSPSGMFTVVFFLKRQLGTRYFSPDMETCQLPPYKPPTKEEETFERMRIAKSRGRLLRTLEDQRSLVAELSQLPGDFAVADGGDVFGFWIRDPGSESAMEHEIAITLAHLRSEKRVPAWLTGEEAIANVLQGNFDVKTFRDYPGCLVLLYQGDFEPTPQTPKKAPRIAAVQVFVEPPPGWPAKSFTSFGMPKDFIENADKELELRGELVSYVDKRQSLEAEYIERLEDSEARPFFSARAKSKDWSAYYGTGASGARYTVLVDFRSEPNDWYPGSQHCG
jgi:hypothetical protein